MTTGALQSCPRIPGHSLCRLSCLDVYLVAAAKGRTDLVVLASFRSIIAGKVPRSLGKLLSLCDGSRWQRPFARWLTRVQRTRQGRREQGGSWGKGLFQVIYFHQPGSITHDSTSAPDSTVRVVLKANPIAPLEAFGAVFPL